MSDSSEPPDLETQVRSACNCGDYQAAATLLIERVGPKVLAYLFHQLRSETDVGEVFSAFSEALWRGLPRFEWRCSVRGWCFVLARNAIRAHRKHMLRQLRRDVLLSDAHIAKLVDSVRERTLPYLRTDMKNELRERFEQLPADDRALLQLRLDQRLSWCELAVVLEHRGKIPSEEELKRSAAKLSQRFHRLKERLR